MTRQPKGFSVLELPEDEHVYTFVSNDGTEPTHIAATTLRRALEIMKWPIIKCMIGAELIKCLERNDICIEPEHALALPEEALETAIIVCEWGTEHVIADGSHRLWRRWKRGDDHFKGYTVPEAVWREFAIYDIPGTGEYWDKFNRTAKVRGG